MVNQVGSSVQVVEQGFCWWHVDGGELATDKPTALTISQSGKAYDVTFLSGATLQQVGDSINDQLQSHGIKCRRPDRLQSLRAGYGPRRPWVRVGPLRLRGDLGLSSSKYVDEPEDALYSIDGVASVSKTNSIEGALSGVNIELVSVSALKTAGDAAKDPDRTATLITVERQQRGAQIRGQGFCRYLQCPDYCDER